MKGRNIFVRVLTKHTAFAISCLLIVSPLSIFSQATLGIDSTNLPGTVFMQTTVAVTVTVTNTGNAAFSGPIDVYYATDSSYTPVLLGNIPFASLIQGGSTVLNTNLLIDISQFDAGNNIVVVWGTSSGIATSNQGWEIIYVDTLAGAVPQLSFDDGICIYPNPAFNILSVEYKSTKNHIESVRIFDLLGNILPLNDHSSVSFSKEIFLEVSSLPQGIYFLEITNNSMQRRWVKFVKR